MTESKVQSLAHVLSQVDEWRAAGKTIVTTNGSYDILHAGHVASLEEAKEQGDILIVGVNSDASVKQYKSADRPIVGERERARLLAGLACVDAVFLFDEVNPIAFLKKIQPDVHTNGADYGEDCVEADTVVSFGGRVHLLAKQDGLSTTAIIKKIQGLPH